MKKKMSRIRRKRVSEIRNLSLYFFIILVGLFSGVFVVSYDVRDFKFIKVKAEEYLKETTIKEIGIEKEEMDFDKNWAYLIKYPSVQNRKVDDNIQSEITKLKDKYLEKYASKKEKTYYFIDYDIYNGVDDIIGLVIHEKIVEDKLPSNNEYIYNFDTKTGEIIKDTFIFTGNYQESINNYLNESKELKNYLELVDFKNFIITTEGIMLKDIKIPYDKIADNLIIDTAKINKKVNRKNISDSDIKFEKIDERSFVARKINVYKKPNKNSEVLETLDFNNVVYLDGSSEDWCRTNKKGFIECRYLNEDPFLLDGFDEIGVKMFAAGTLMVNESPEKNSEVIGSFNFQDEIEVLGIKGEWAQILFNDMIAFTTSKYLLSEKPEIKKITVNADGTRNLDPNRPMVALTFDDGPNPKSTGRILDTLEKYGAVATFFDVGNLVDTYPDVTKREESIGCEVGSHTYSHANLNTLSADGIIAEISGADEAFIRALGHKVTLLRPPYGNANSLVRATSDHILVNWDVDTLDWQSRNKDAILNEVHAFSELDGRIILMHSIYESTADAVEALVPELIYQGYQLVTISELAKYKNETLETGRIYYSFR